MIQQSNRIGSAIQERYSGAQRGTTAYNEARSRIRRSVGAYNRYTSNIANRLGGRASVSGNSRLLNTRVSRATYMGLTNG